MVERSRFLKVSLALVIVLVILFVIHLGTGFAEFSYLHLLKILLGGGEPWENITVFDFRMVRSVLAVLIGIGLGLSGAIFQTITRNELASPSLLGVNAGASLAVIIFVFFEPVSALSTIWKSPLVAVIGGAIAAGLIFRLSYRKGRTLSPLTLVLNGIALSAGIHAIQLVMLVKLPFDKFNQVNTWLIGSFFGNSWAHVLALFVVIVIAGFIFYAGSIRLNILNLNEETAIGLGANITKERFLYLAVAVILSGASIAIGGSIGFIGLIAPHIARRLVGVNHKYYLPVTGLVGAVVLIAADWVAQVIIAPDEMLVGIIVALIGAPYFLYILARTRG